MNMEALIKKPRPFLKSAHQDLTNRAGLELIGHIFIDFIDIFSLKKSGSATGSLQRIIIINNPFCSFFNVEIFHD